MCELLAGDEIVTINGVEAGKHYKESVMHVIEQAVTSGQLDLRIRRYLSPGRCQARAAPHCWTHASATSLYLLT